MKKIIDLINKIGQDKYIHFLVGLLLAWVVYTIYFAITHLVYDSLVITEASVLLVSVCKESIIDDKFDVKDFIATILGNFMALVMIFV